MLICNRTWDIRQHSEMAVIYLLSILIVSVITGFKNIGTILSVHNKQCMTIAEISNNVTYFMFVVQTKHEACI
jgi:hypothetical protein